MGDRALVRKDEIGIVLTRVTTVVRPREPRITLLPDCATRSGSAD
jgi:hypothetical protein